MQGVWNAFLIKLLLLFFQAVWLCKAVLEPKHLVMFVFQVLNKTKEFEEAVKKVIKDVNLDNDIVVSVFETNIRVLGWVTFTFSEFFTTLIFS